MNGRPPMEWLVAWCHMVAVGGADGTEVWPLMVKNPRSGEAPFLSAASGMVNLLGELPSKSALTLVVDAGRVPICSLANAISDVCLLQLTVK